MAVRRNETSVSQPASAVRALLIDDEADSMFPVLAQGLEARGFRLAKETRAANALNAVKDTKPDVILLDLHFPGDDAMASKTTGGRLLAEIRQKFEPIPVVVFTNRLDDVDIPMETFDVPPHGYFAKPDFDKPGWAERLDQDMRSAIDTARFMRAPDDGDLGFLVGQTKEMRDAVARIRAAARNTLPVLIYGETGSGKQLAAEAIHRLSERKGRFEHFNCAGTNGDTLDSTLFGHVRGAFTGAVDTKPGLFELADKGTLFLDEFQHIPTELQDKLMTVVESGVFRPLGGKADKKVDVRLIVATNHNLSDLAMEGRLREDLGYRLGVLLIALPSLRQRMSDLLELFEIFIAKANKATNRNVFETLRPETRQKLESHDWPGNIRELEATIKRAVAGTSSNVLRPEDIEFLPIARSRPAVDSAASPLPSIAPPSAAPIDIDSPDALTALLTDRLEGTPLVRRYQSLMGHERNLRTAILTEFICRLRKRTGKKVGHKQLAAELDTLVNGVTDYDKIRQFVSSCGVRLTELECNQ